ncbi:TetR/AcrR family transcriptional regulator [Romboutsia sp.]|uniref:TetR/AcrR family transcriptional regulator n=1 Tax=Romboutsia sp. TaxID=1965302 RepID=UPI003F3512F3
MAKNPTQVAITKQCLKDAFWSLYKSKKINQVSIKEITDIAGYNRGTFYLYYKDVYHLLEEIEDELLDSLEEVSKSMINMLVSCEDYIYECNKFFEYFKQNMEYISVLLGENGDAYFQSKYKQVLKFQIKSHLNMDITDYTEENIDFSLEFFISGQIGLMMYYFSKNKEADVDALIKISRTIIAQSGISDLLK